MVALQLHGVHDVRALYRLKAVSFLPGAELLDVCNDAIDIVRIHYTILHVLATQHDINLSIVVTDRTAVLNMAASRPAEFDLFERYILRRWICVLKVDGDIIRTVVVYDVVSR